MTRKEVQFGMVEVGTDAKPFEAFFCGVK